MPESPVISVIIVSWNAKAYLQECLESLLLTIGEYPVEIIVVDNASTDGSPELVTSLFPTVQLIRNQANLGFAKANNAGMRISTGKYVCLVNSDVRVLEGCIAKLLAFMDTHPEVGLAGPCMLDSSGKIGRSCRGFPTVWNMFCNAVALDSVFPHIKLFGGYAMRYWRQDTSRAVDILGGWFWIARSSALSEVGLLDEDFFFYAEDMDWCKRFSAKGWKVEFFAEAASVHYGGGSSKQAPLKYYIQQQRADLRFWRKHYSSAECGAYFLVCIVYHLNRAIVHGLLSVAPAKRKSHASTASRSWHCLLWYLSGAK